MFNVLDLMHAFVRRLAFVLLILALTSCSLMSTPASAAPENEYFGKLDSGLVADSENLDRVVFKPIRDLSKIKFAIALDPSDKVSVGRLHHPPLDKSAILTLLVEPEGDTPFLYADLNLDNTMSEGERFTLTRGEDDSPYLLETTLKLPLAGNLFTHFPVFVQYFRNVKFDDMNEGERLLMQSKTAFAKGLVDVAGRKTLVQFGYNPGTKKISATNGWIGVDGDADNQIDMDRLSPEAAEAREETIVFRVGDNYVSVKRVDLEKNQITLRAHPASDYKRVELRVGIEVPDFAFTDFKNKKRKLSEFRGKYVLIDFWGTWCPPCRQELPYLKAAYQRYQARGFEILGMDNDEDTMFVKAWLEKNGLNWTQATTDRIRDVMSSFRVRTFPTTLLIGPDGKVISLNQRKKNQPPLRGNELLKTLDKILPP